MRSFFGLGLTHKGRFGRPDRSIRQGFQRAVLTVGACLFLSGCVLSKAIPDYAISANESDDVERLGAATVKEQQARANAGAAPYQTGVRQTTVVPSIGETTPQRDNAINGPNAPAIAVGEVDTIVPALALPAFVDLVFGEMLSVPYTTGPGIAKRTEIIQLRSSGKMPADVFLDLVSMTLKDYGVQVTTENGVYQVLEDSALRARIPRFIRSRAKATTPAGLRPVVQYVELNAIDASTMAGILNQTFGSQSNNLKVSADSNGNYVILTGLPDDVNAALSIIYDMDELQFAGTQVQRFSPNYWEVRELAQQLQVILNAEGWQVSLTANSPKPILLLPVIQSNDLLAFTREPAARNRINYWIQELDRATRKGDEPQIFVYSVRNMDAKVLAQTVNEVIGNLSARSPGQVGIAARVAAAAAANRTNDSGDGRGLREGGALVVDPLGNRLIYSGMPAEYDRLLPILQQLDVPPAEVLIEAMVAQVTLSDSTSLGVDWALANLNDGGFQGSSILDDNNSGLDGVVSRGTFGPGGLAFGVFNPDVEVNISALASNNKVNVLSTPRLLARSGSSATVQVGQQVPILASQISSIDSGQDGGRDAFQQVQYRNTGIILSIEPIVFSDNRIDLTISQEISSALPSGGGELVASPTFNNTSVSTLLSLEDGGTAVIGGLIQDNFTQDESGVPLLKDIPGVGRLFSSSSSAVDRTELVILIKAYVIRGQADRSAFANKYKNEIDRTLSEDNLTTLRPRSF